MTNAEIRTLPAGYKLDQLIWEILGCPPPFIRRFSLSIDSAFDLVDLLAKLDCRLFLKDWRGLDGPLRGWSASFELPDAHDTGDFIAPTAPHAICLALLAAVEQLRKVAK